MRTPGPTSTPPPRAAASIVFVYIFFIIPIIDYYDDYNSIFLQRAQTQPTRNLWWDDKLNLSLAAQVE